MTSPEHDHEPEDIDATQDVDRRVDPELDFDAAFAALVAQFNAPDPVEPGTSSREGNEADPTLSEDSRLSADTADEADADLSRLQGSIPKELPPEVQILDNSPIAPMRPEGIEEPIPPKRQPQTSEPIQGSTTDAPWYPPELDEHFEPPDPGPIPRGDLMSRMAWIAVLGGPAVLMLAALLRGALPGWLVITALVAFLAGFVGLVAQMPSDRSDDGDDGAVV